jgi:hypothetical protein
LRSLDQKFLEQQGIPIEMGGLIEALGEFRGRQQLFLHQTPQVLESLRQAAIIESTESSNKIEGVTVPPDRFKQLMLNPTRPKDRSEAEILGYRSILSQIHITPERFQIKEDTILIFQREIYAQTGIEGGKWKTNDNTIEERLPEGRWSKFLEQEIILIEPLLIVGVGTNAFQSLRRFVVDILEVPPVLFQVTHYSSRRNPWDDWGKEFPELLRLLSRLRPRRDWTECGL